MHADDDDDDSLEWTLARKNAAADYVRSLVRSFARLKRSFPRASHHSIRLPYLQLIYFLWFLQSSFSLFFFLSFLSVLFAS
jgi:hypothetical protein